jgi:Type II secretion system (T2SS), protein E, N-terminal domain
MSALTSLLVRDRVVPVSKIEQALHAQVFQGGDIEVILLEMGVVAEDVLSAYRAALFDLLPATRDEVMKASREALRRMPADLARSLGMVPIFFEGRTLVVAGWEPLYEPRLSELEAQLGCDVTVRIVNQPRLASALSHHYGFELEPRLRRLSDALRRRHPGVVPYVRPPAQSMRPLRQSEAEPSEDVQGELEPGPPPTAAAPSESELAYAQLEVEPLPPEQVIELREPEPREPEPRAAEPREPVAGLLDAAPDAASEEPDIDLPTGVSPQLAAILRGSIDLERATELLQVTSKRDDVLFVLLRYVQHAFDFVCVFSVGKDGARARMAYGAGLTRDIVEHVAIPSPRDGVLAAAIRERRPVVGEFGATPEEEPAARALHRERGRTALLVPIALNDRAVLVVYAERVRQGLSVSEAAIVHALMPAVLAALRRLILANKADKQRESLAPPAFDPPPLVEEPLLLVTPLTPAAEPLQSVEPPSLEPPPSFGPPAAEPVGPEGDDLRAVDLDAFEQLASADAAKAAAARPSERAREPRDKGQRLAGVPRPPPPPPAYEAPAPVQANAGYRQRGGAAQERAVAPERPVVQERAPEPPAPAVAEQPERAADEMRSRLSLVEPTVEMPSVIIDMGESVDALIDGLLRAPAGSDPPEVGDLLTVGEGVLPVLTQHFPGPLWFDRHQPHKRRPRGRDVSPVARAIAAFGERAAPYVASVLSGGDPDRTFYGLMLASELVHPDLIDPVARRVLEKDDALRVLALEVLRRYAVLPQYDVVLRAISDLSERPGKDPRRQRLAVEALGELRDSRALRSLIARLTDRDEQVVRSAHRALVVLTGQDFGTMQRRWETWAEGWGRAHRVEWLIESLLHADEPVRTLAGEELKLLTQQYFGYHPALPRKDRELAQRKYREWWELEGRLAFTR